MNQTPGALEYSNKRINRAIRYWISDLDYADCYMTGDDRHDYSKWVLVKEHVPGKEAWAWCNGGKIETL